MKQCPLCNRYFDDENDFCLEDGTPLSVPGGANPFGGHGTIGSLPTEVVPNISTPSTELPTEVYQAPYTQQPQQYQALPHQPPPQPQGSSGNLLYLVIGVLATALIGLTAYMFLLRDKDNPSAPAAANASAQGAPSASSVPGSTPAATPVSNRAASTSTPSADIAPPLVGGQWSGEISYPSGTAFSASAQLSDTGANTVTGRITWTLLRSSNPEKQGKVGISATEYVDGAFDPAGKVLTLRGASKSDPSNIIILDRYRLNISPDSRSFTGVSTGGKIPGRVSLRRN